MPADPDKLHDLNTESTVDSCTPTAKPEHAGKCNNMLAVFNVVNTSIGLGMLKLPLELDAAGWIGGVSLLVATNFVALYCLLLFYETLAHNKTGRILVSFEEAGYVTFGHPGRLLCWMVVYSYLLILLVVILSLFGNALLTVFPENFGLQLPAWTAVSGVLVLPLALLPSMTEVGWVSALAVLSIMVVVFVVIAIAITQALDSDESPQYTMGPKSFIDFSGSLSVFLLSYFCTHTAPTVLHDMKTPSDYPKVALVSSTAVMLIYGLVSIIAYAALGSRLASFDTVLEAVSPDPSNPSATSYVLQAGVVVMVASHYMITYAPCGAAIDRNLANIHSTSASLQRFSLPKLKLLFRVLLVVATGIAAVCLPNGKVGPLLDLIASVNAVFMAVTLPVVFYWKSLYQMQKPHPSKLRLAFEVLVVCTGGMCTVLGFMDALESARTVWGSM